MTFKQGDRYDARRLRTNSVTKNSVVRSGANYWSPQRGTKGCAFRATGRAERGTGRAERAVKSGSANPCRITARLPVNGNMVVINLSSNGKKVGNEEASGVADVCGVVA